MVFKENKPIYKQIADRICDEILTMEYRDESRIPSVREHAATLDVNVNTIVRAYDYLLELDILYTRPGLGFFVKPGAKHKVLACARRSSWATSCPSSSPASPSWTSPSKRLWKSTGA